LEKRVLFKFKMLIKVILKIQVTKPKSKKLKGYRKVLSMYSGGNLKEKASKVDCNLRVA
jgi:hypothetical protein